jgi:hypothetical protein
MLQRGSSFGVILGFLMSIVYVGLGVFLFASGRIFNLTDFQKYGLGFILVVYGLFRWFRTMKVKKENEEDE